MNKLNIIRFSYQPQSADNYSEFFSSTCLGWNNQFFYPHSKRKNYYLLIILILDVFISCTPDQSSHIPVINPGTIKEEKIMLSDIASGINYIPLCNEILFGGIVSIESTDSLIFVTPIMKGLLVYNTSGQLKARIGKKGKGPGEYIYGFRFTLDRNNKIVYVLDKEKILKYTFTGQFLGDIPLTRKKQLFNHVVFSNGKLYLYEGINLGYGKYDWIITDTLGHILSEKLNSIKQFPSAHYCKGSKQEAFNNTLFYWNQINDTIFKIDDEKYKPAFLFAQGDFRFPKKKIRAVSTEYFFPRVIFFTKHYLFVAYNYQFQNCTGIYKISEQQLYVVNKTKDLAAVIGPGIVNDFDGGLPLVPISYYCNEKQEEFIIGQISPFQLKAHVTSETFKNFTPKYPDKKKELEKLANSLDENDNPVLMLVKLKR